MPFNSLALLAVLAFGLMWLLGVFFMSNVELFWVIAMHTFIVGFFFYFIHHVTVTEEKLTQTILPPSGHLTGRLDRHFVPNKVCDLDPTFHRCTWKCHRNFDRDNCITLCGDNCVHLNCNNHHCPDLFPPPASYPSTSVLASLPFQRQPTSTFIDTYANDILLCYCHPQAHPPTPDWADGAYLELSFSALTLMVMSLSSRETVETAVQLLTSMSADEYMRMIDPIQYHPDLFRDVVFPPEVPTPHSLQWCEQVPWVSEDGKKVVKVECLPLYLLQMKVNLFGFPSQNFHNIIHGSQCLAHHVTIPFNFTGNDVNLPDIGPTIYILVEFPYMMKTSQEGLFYWNEPLASVYEGMGLAFPVASYHDTLQILVHN